MSFADRDGVIWFNGELVPWREAKVHALTHTLHYGMGVFEGVRAYDAGKLGMSIFRLHEHTERLFNSAHIMQMQIPWSKEEINEAQKQVVRENNLHECYLRPLVFYGSEEMGLRVDKLKAQVIVATWQWPSYVNPESKNQGIKVRTSSFTRHHVNISMCKAKACGHYINSILALQEALDSGCEEALLLDTEGYVSEGSGENIFIVRNNEIYTPDLTTCLSGITRNTLLTLARDSGYTIHEKRITRDEVYIADEAFFTGTAAEVLPIRELDGRTIGEGGCGPVTEKLQQLFFNAVRGKLEQYSHWLSPVA